MPDRDRDQSVEQWLRQTPLAGARVDDCLDAEMLAAWAEGTLDGPARTTAEAHAANCARCQAMLAVMVRTTPVASVTSRSPVRRWLMFLGPALAAATAVALWVAVDRNERPTSLVDSLAKEQPKAERTAEVAQGPPPPVGAEKEVDRKATGDARRELGERAGIRTEASTRVTAAPGNEGADKKDLTAAKRADMPRDAEQRRAAASPAAAPAPPPPPPAQSKPAESVQVMAATPPVVVAPPGPAPQQQVNQAPNQNQAQAANQNQASSRQQLAGATEERVVVAEPPLNRAAGDTTSGRGAGRGGAGGAFADAAAARLRTAAGAFDVAVPESPVRWRVADGRTVQRSLDTGTTWTAHYAAGDGVFLTAGSAPSPSVCWLVGRSGAIIVTTDGRAWQPVKFPEPVDLIAVASSNARAATVTTVDGRRFATTDGGRTWVRQ